jgi:RHS repeat-associated protein
LPPDHLGFTSGQTDASGNPVNGRDERFYAYGRVRAGDPTQLSTDRTFTGQKSDGAGLLYYNARYYDPALGTFLSPDTVAPDAQPLREPPHDDASSVCPAHWSYAMILTDLYDKNTYDKNTAISPLS